ncbi:hypothetical protein EBS02_10625, partial [bacterium]|nr:hypothetical protein [bacterium]
MTDLVNINPQVQIIPVRRTPDITVYKKDLSEWWETIKNSITDLLQRFRDNFIISPNEDTINERWMKMGICLLVPLVCCFLLFYLSNKYPDKFYGAISNSQIQQFLGEISEVYNELQSLHPKYSKEQIIWLVFERAARGYERVRFCQLFLLSLLILSTGALLINLASLGIGRILTSLFGQLFYLMVVATLLVVRKYFKTFVSLSVEAGIAIMCVIAIICLLHAVYTDTSGIAWAVLILSLLIVGISYGIITVKDQKEYSGKNKDYPITTLPPPPTSSSIVRYEGFQGLLPYSSENALSMIT